MEKIKIEASDGLMLSCLYSKTEKPIGAIQIIHGMQEHKERYIKFIEFLNEKGFNVIIADLRGHGESINDTYPLGFLGSIDILKDDEHRITEYLKKHSPNMNYYLFGHSMGSLIARAYIETYDFDFKKLVLSGTVNPRSFVGLGIFLAKLKCMGNGKYKHSNLLEKLSGNNPDLEWLSYNKENIKAYKENPLCGFPFTNNGYKVLFEMTRNLKKRKRYGCLNPDMPIISLSGVDDPVTGGTKGVHETIKRLMFIGYRNLKYAEYPNMKHEILNENNNIEVFEDIAKFYDEKAL